MQRLIGGARPEGGVDDDDQDDQDGRAKFGERPVGNGRSLVRFSFARTL